MTGVDIDDERVLKIRLKIVKGDGVSCFGVGGNGVDLFSVLSIKF